MCLLEVPLVRCIILLVQQLTISVECYGSSGMCDLLVIVNLYLYLKQFLKYFNSYVFLDVFNAIKLSRNKQKKTLVWLGFRRVSLSSDTLQIMFAGQNRCIHAARLFPHILLLKGCSSLSLKLLS